MENPGLGQSQQCGVSQGIEFVVVEFYPWLKLFFPLFLCAVMDGNEVCVKNIFLSKVQSAVKYQFASLRPDGRLGLSLCFSGFLQWLRFNQYRPHDDIFCLVFHYCPKFRTVDKKLKRKKEIEQHSSTSSF